VRLAGLLVFLVVLATVDPAKHGYWQEASPMAVAGTSQVTTLLSNGDVLNTGGEETEYGLPARTAERYNVTSRTWSLEPSMHSARIGHTATLLADGSVLVVGGLGRKLQPLSSAEVYDPLGNVWAQAPPLPATRFSQSASLLPDGDVMIVGGIVNGTISRSTLIFRPGGGPWEAGPPTLYAHAQQDSLTLPDGRILLAGGYGGPPEMFDWKTGSWSAVASPGFRTHPVLASLGDGEVLLAAGDNRAGHAVASAQLFDPSTGRWKWTNHLVTARDTPIGVELSDGRILVAGGGGPHMDVLRSAEIYDPKTGGWYQTGSLRQGRSAATAVVLQDGTVLVCGGSWFGAVLSSCEVYHP
jgi:hypothetical protein